MPLHRDSAALAASRVRDGIRFKKVETDLQKIRKLAKEREDENWQFRTFLKSYDGTNLDSMVYKLVEQVSQTIDCTACGNCCREFQPIIKKKDIIKLTKGLNMTPDQFRKDFVKKDEDGDTVFKQIPCPFLSGNKCLHYDSRPVDCRSFPHIHKKYFTTRLIGSHIRHTTSTVQIKY